MNKPTIVDLAHRIEADIRKRGLRPGDPYLGQAETKRMLGVGSDSANRALQLLAQRGVISRGQRRGTFVANLSPRDNSTTLRHVHVVVDEYYLRHERTFSDSHLLGLQQELPGASLEFNFLPSENVAEFAQDLVHQALAMQGQHGFVATSCPFAVQRVFADSGLPTVIAGSPYPSINTLPAVDHDHAQGAALMADFLSSGGCCKFLLLFRRRVAAGENWALDAVLKEFSDRGFSLGDIRVRTVDDDPFEARAEIGAAWEHFAGHKLGIVARTEPLAFNVLKEAEDRGLELQVDYGLIGANIIAPQESPQLPFAVVHREISAYERGARLGRLLKSVAAGEPAESCFTPMRLTLPVTEA